MLWQSGYTQRLFSVLLKAIRNVQYKGTRTCFVSAQRFSICQLETMQKNLFLSNKTFERTTILSCEPSTPRSPISENHARANALQKVIQGAPA